MNSRPWSGSAPTSFPCFAHDLKSPLISIQGFVLRILTKGSKLPKAKQVQYLRVIKREAEALEVLINDFLDFFSIGDGKFIIEFERHGFE